MSLISYTHDVLQVRSKSIVTYQVKEWYGAGSSPLPQRARSDKTRTLSRLLNLKDTGTYSGDITVHARKRIARAVSLLVQSSKWQTVDHPVTKQPINFRLGFCTLTIPVSDQVKAKWAYQYLLKPFLAQMRYKCGLKSYVWKAELQERGQLHYHITTDCYMPFYYVRDAWANLLRKHDLFGSEHAGKHNSEVPCTEVKRVYKIKNVESYLVKYISKSDGTGRSVFGKAWGCSDNLRGAKYFTEVFESVNAHILQELENAGRVTCKVLDKCVLWLFNDGYPAMALSPVQRMQYRDHIQFIARGSP